MNQYADWSVLEGCYLTFFMIIWILLKSFLQRVCACFLVRFLPQWRPIMPWGKSSLNADVCANDMCVCVCVLTPVAASFRVKWSVCDSVPVRVSKWYDDTSCSFPTRLNWISCWNIICLRLQAWARWFYLRFRPAWRKRQWENIHFLSICHWVLRISIFLHIKSRLFRALQSGC